MKVNVNVRAESRERAAQAVSTASEERISGLASVTAQRVQPCSGGARSQRAAERARGELLPQVLRTVYVDGRLDKQQQQQED